LSFSSVYFRFILAFIGVLQEIRPDITRKVGFAALNRKSVASFAKASAAREARKAPWAPRAFTALNRETTDPPTSGGRPDYDVAGCADLTDSAETVDNKTTREQITYPLAAGSSILVSSQR
jgi:hypothetical protein